MKFTVSPPTPASSPAFSPALRAPLPTTEPARWRPSGTPQDRLARVAARRAFVEMKQCFMRAVADAEGAHVPLLQWHVRQTTDVMDLWVLRDVVIESLPRDSVVGERHRRELQSHLDAAFPDGADEGRLAQA
jgi:hypothetical protein